MMHRAWSSIVDVPYCFSRSYIKFQGHTALKIVEFDPNWAFPDSNSCLNSPMAMKCCTKLETAKERCPIVFQGHPSNFKVTRYKTSPILTQIGRFRTIGRSQLSNPSDLPCFDWICPDVSKLAQYLQLVVWQIFVDLPFLPKVGLSGMLERTSKSRSRGFLRAPQVSLESYRSLVRSEVPNMVQFPFGILNHAVGVSCIIVSIFIFIFTLIKLMAIWFLI